MFLDFRPLLCTYVLSLLSNRCTTNFLWWWWWRYVTHRNRRKRARDIKSFESLPTTITSSEWFDPLQPSRSDLEQPAVDSKQPTIGSGRAISPEELQKALAIISTRDDAHRMANTTVSPLPRSICQTLIQWFVFSSPRQAVCYGKTSVTCVVPVTGSFVRIQYWPII